jgi:hypothetical protein
MTSPNGLTMRAVEAAKADKAVYAGAPRGWWRSNEGVRRPNSTDCGTRSAAKGSPSQPLGSSADLNTATRGELGTIPDVGPSDYRDEAVRFDRRFGK